MDNGTSSGVGLTAAPLRRLQSASSGPLELNLHDCYERYGPMVLRRCHAILRDQARAEDAMQDVFVRLLAHEGQLHATGLSSLLYRMATQVSLNKLRGQRRRPEDRDEELLGRIADSGDQEEASAARRLLARLFGDEPDTTRVMATLHLYDGLTLEEVAREMGMSVSGVRKRLRGLRASLHELAGEVS